MAHHDEEQELQSVALQTTRSVRLARDRVERELLETREALRQSEARLRAIVDQAAVGIAIASLDGRFVEVNRKFCEILGYDSAELLRMSALDITHPADRESTDASMERLLAGRIRDYSVEKRYVRKSGAVVWSLTTVTTLKNSEGVAERFIGVIEDITARKQAEVALHEETRMLELLNSAGQTLASKLDREELVQAITDAATSLCGARFGAFFYNTTDEGGDALMLYTLSGASREAFAGFGNPRATALFGPTFRGEAPVRSDDVRQDPRYGRMAPHHGMPAGHLPVRSYLAVPVRSRSGEVLGGLFFGHPEPGVFTERSERLIVGLAGQAGIALDNARLFEAAQQAASQREALLERERAARAMSEKLSDMKDGFLATLSHELRTPLNAILGWARILQTTAHDSGDLARGLETIERNATAQAQLIDDLLDMSRITSGQLRLDIQPVQPIVVIEAAAETVRPAADAKGIRIESMLDPSAGPVSGDPGRLQQVVWNLLSNAVKFTPRGGKVQVVLERVNSHIEIAVADTGCGIAPEFMPHLFDRFRQGDAATTRRFGGLGLGLSIVKNLVELHGGRVSARSDGEGRGTTVTVSLPLAAVNRAPGDPRVHPVTADPRSAPFSRTDLSNLRLLVVDDDPDGRDLVRYVLEACGATAVVAGSAAEAVGLIEQVAPDIVITDIGMPGTDGYELLRQIRGLEHDAVRRVPAIALTAFARAEDRTRALRSGFVVHLAKPVDPSELAATVASVAGRLGAEG